MQLQNQLSIQQQELLQQLQLVQRQYLMHQRIEMQQQHHPHQQCHQLQQQLQQQNIQSTTGHQTESLLLGNVDFAKPLHDFDYQQSQQYNDLNQTTRKQKEKQQKLPKKLTCGVDKLKNPSNNFTDKYDDDDNIGKKLQIPKQSLSPETSIAAATIPTQNKNSSSPTHHPSVIDSSEEKFSINNNNLQYNNNCLPVTENLEKFNDEEMAQAEAVPDDLHQESTSNETTGLLKNSDAHNNECHNDLNANSNKTNKNNKRNNNIKVKNSNCDDGCSINETANLVGGQQNMEIANALMMTFYSSGSSCGVSSTTTTSTTTTTTAAGTVQVPSNSTANNYPNYDEYFNGSDVSFGNNGQLPPPPPSHHHHQAFLNAVMNLNHLSTSATIFDGAHNGTAGNQQHEQQSQQKYYHPLYAHGTCRWPGCELLIDDIGTFVKHLNAEHCLDDRSTAQARVQMQVVSQLEIHLQKERDRLQSMMHHLYLTKYNNNNNSNNNNNNNTYRNYNTISRSGSRERDEEEMMADAIASAEDVDCFDSVIQHLQHQQYLNNQNQQTTVLGGGGGGSGGLLQVHHHHRHHQQGQNVQSHHSHHQHSHPQHTSHAKNSNLKENGRLFAAVAAASGAPYIPLNLQEAGAAAAAAAAAAIRATTAAATASSILQNQHISSSIRKRISDKSPLAISGGLPYMLERAGLDVQQEIQRNREFYKNNDVRPPFTYASLIRQSIIESPDKQLTLNEIYNWFQNTFCYFRRNAATWKNAIRTNLSLHKCFVRYEDDFGSFWMVDDTEFVKRRHLSRGRPRKYEPPTTSSHGQSSSANSSPNCGSQNQRCSSNSSATTALTTSAALPHHHHHNHVIGANGGGMCSSGSSSSIYESAANEIAPTMATKINSNNNICASSSVRKEPTSVSHSVVSSGGIFTINGSSDPLTDFKSNICGIGGGISSSCTSLTSCASSGGGATSCLIDGRVGRETLNCGDSSAAGGGIGGISGGNQSSTSSSSASCIIAGYHITGNNYQQSNQNLSSSFAANSPSYVTENFVPNFWSCPPAPASATNITSARTTQTIFDDSSTGINRSNTPASSQSGVKHARSGRNSPDNLANSFYGLHSHHYHLHHHHDEHQQLRLQQEQQRQQNSHHNLSHLLSSSSAGLSLKDSNLQHNETHSLPFHHMTAPSPSTPTILSRSRSSPTQSTSSSRMFTSMMMAAAVSNDIGGVMAAAAAASMASSNNCCSNNGGNNDKCNCNNSEQQQMIFASLVERKNTHSSHHQLPMPQLLPPPTIGSGAANYVHHSGNYNYNQQPTTDDDDDEDENANADDNIENNVEMKIVHQQKQIISSGSGSRSSSPKNGNDEIAKPSSLSSSLTPPSSNTHRENIKENNNNIQPMIVDEACGIEVDGKIERIKTEIPEDLSTVANAHKPIIE